MLLHPIKRYILPSGPFRLQVPTKSHGLLCGVLPPILTLLILLLDLVLAHQCRYRPYQPRIYGKPLLLQLPQNLAMDML